MEDEGQRRWKAALDLIARIESAPDIPTLNAWFGKVAALFGVKYFSVTLLGEHGKPLTPRILAAHTQQAWARRYFERNFFAIDPTLAEMRTTVRPFTWDHTEAKYRSRGAQALFHDVRSTGVQDGIDIPWHTADGLLGIVTLKGERIDDSSNARATLRMVATYYAEVARELAELGDDARSEAFDLTERQVECLTWAAEGKSDWEISQILAIAEGTVQRHFEIIRQKLNVTTRVQAIVIALRRGWIMPSTGSIHTTTPPSRED